MDSESVAKIISQLTLAEKVTLLSGIGACQTNSNDRLNIPSLHVCIPLSDRRQTPNEIRHPTAHTDSEEAVVGFSTR
jgi:hypothetical protein